MEHYVKLCVFVICLASPIASLHDLFQLFDHTGPCVAAALTL